MKDYDAYLFDWDGTLVQTLEIWLQLIRSQLNKFGVQADDKDIVFKTFGRVEKGVVELGLPNSKLPDFMAELKVLAPKRVAAAALYPDAKELLTALKCKSKKLALITASHRDVLNVVINEHDLSGLFDVIVCGDEVKEHKPNPEGLQLAMRELGVDPSRTLMLGDSDKDLRAGNNAAVDTLLFFPEGHEIFHVKEQLLEYGPKFTIPSWRKMIDQVQ